MTASELTREALEQLLANLDPDRAEAGRRYVEIRERLVRLFAWRGCQHPDELADEAINRVAQKIAAGLEIRSGDRFRYFCGVAFLVFKEILRRERREREALVALRHEPAPVEDDDEPDRERSMLCLRSCLIALGHEGRDLLLAYHQGDGADRIRIRKRLADGLGIPMNALRIRVHRLRGRLEDCVHGCLENSPRA